MFDSMLDFMTEIVEIEKEENLCFSYAFQKK